MISFIDAEFPRELHNIPDAPVVLFGKGNLSILKSKIKQLNLTLLNMPMKRTMTHITKFNKDTSPVKVPTTKPQRIPYKRTLYFY